MSGLRLHLAGFALATAALMACGVPTGEDSFDPINDEEVPFRLGDTATTTSTSTTMVPVTSVPDTTLPDAPATTAESTTTTLPTEMVAVYLLSRDRLQAVPGELPVGYGIGQLVALLEVGPPEGAAGIGLETRVEEGLILDSTTSGGVVTVELDEIVFDEIEPQDQRPAIAQIVLTLTGNLRGIGQVSFTLAGNPIGVPKGDGLLSEPGEPLAFDDYASMLAEPTIGSSGIDPESSVTDPPTETTSTTSSTTTTSTTTTTGVPRQRSGDRDAEKTQPDQ